MQTNRRVGLRELTVPECLSLLATVDHGWIAITQKALPAILPVRLEVVGSEAVVASLLGGSVPLVTPEVVAIAAGDLGQGGQAGWTVEVVGLLRETGAGSGAGRTFERFEELESFTVACDRVRGWSAS